MAERFTLARFEETAFPTRTRFPFKYGIASMTDVPHLFLRTRVTVGARSCDGLAAEGLPPKWFTKNPATTFEQDLPEMFEVIRHAAAAASDIARTPVSFFDLWRELYRGQMAWAEARGLAPLLAGLGVSLVERAVLDGLCRLAGQPLHRLVAANTLGLRLGDVHPELGEAEPADLLPATPVGSCFVRHTIGLGDQLTPADISDGDRVDDGLPQDLQSSIRAYGLRYFKVKLSGAAVRDVPRLQQLAELLDVETGGEYGVTVDGNENFQEFDAFRDFWQDLVARPALRNLWRRVIAVEQPVHRDRALTEDVRTALAGWKGRPPLIVDESDGAVADVLAALDLGYSGASHKNCKGIVKGIANACLLRQRRGLLTGEDLCTLGPVALLQDLAMMSLLWVDHVERNGHHYYRGLSMFPGDWQEAMLAAHGDIYRRHRDGFAHLSVDSGKLQLASVNAAPFGVQPAFDPATLPVQRVAL